jgi:hypothetical protein
MGKTVFPVEDLSLKPTPKSSECPLVEEGTAERSNPEEALPEEPPELVLPPEYQGLDVVVIGPKYGDIVVKLTDDDGSMVERFAYRVIDEEQNKVAAKTDTREIPPEIKAALLKTGWFCTDWGENYTATGADYLASLGAACKELAERKDFEESSNSPFEDHELIGSSLLLPESYQPDKIADITYRTLMAVYYSKLLRNGACHDSLREEIEHRIAADDMTGPTEAINQIIRERHDQEGQPDVQESQIIKLGSSEEGERDPGQQVMASLTRNTVSNDVPNTCINYLPEFGPETDGHNYWDTGRATVPYYHLPYHQIDDRYMVNTEVVERDGDEILQVGVVTGAFGFYEEFRQVQENEYITSNAGDRLPAIYCAAVVRARGGEIRNLPTLDEASIEGVYLAIAEVVVKIFKKDSNLHNETLRKLDDVTSTIRAQAMGKASETETVDQEDLPTSATGDGQHTVFSQEQFNDGLVGRLPDSMEKIGDAIEDEIY